MGLIYTETAIADLEHIRRYVTAYDPEAARRLAVRLATAGDRLDALAKAGKLPVGIAEAAIVYPFLIRYRTTDDCAVLSIRHSTRALIR